MPTTTEIAVTTTAIVSVVPTAPRIASSRTISPYQRTEKPCQDTTDRCASLNESATSTTSGRYRNTNTTPMKTRSHALVR